MEFISPAQPEIEKVRNDITDDLAFSILSKLSLKSLYRFGCVHKSWTLLFRDSYFMNLFLKNLVCHNRSYYDDMSLLLLQNMNINDEDKYELYSLSGERFEHKTKLDWPNPFQEVDPQFYVVGSDSIHGTLCLICYSQPNNRVVLWNPTNKEFKVIPTSLRESLRYMDVEITRHGFAYDSINDDYKVIRQVMYDRNSDTDSDTDDLSLDGHGISYDLFWEIYSLRSNSWKKLRFDVPYDYRDEGLCLDGVCHWLGEDAYDDDSEDEIYLLSIDLGKEVLHITPISSEDDYSWKDLFVINGSIALISICEEMNTFYISVLGELGVKESWTKLYNFCPLPSIERPIKSGKKGYIFPTLIDGKQVCFDFNTLMAEKRSLVGFKKSIIYKECSLPIGGINQ
ncbi:F-box/kelch-repeat protein [Trifolium repens]|nr:F-box/kelch-repeat protein [Trifolium repens]